MTKSSFREQDYSFGQRMLTLRMAIGLSQAGLGKLLGVSRHAVGGWEAGQTYPKPDHLKHLIALGVEHHAFAAGHEADEIRALWHSANQKVLLDEAWLQDLLSPQASPPLVQLPRPDLPIALPAVVGPRVDWGDALDVPTFYGREGELTQLIQWVVGERCRLVSVLGMGGIGKSALAVALMRRVASHFDVVIWRSLRDAPACETLLDEYLHVLAPQLQSDAHDSLEGRLGILMEQLRAQRVLLVLDNGETLLEEGAGIGRMRAGFEGYGRLLQRTGETAHQSCLLLTSREKPAELVPLEGSRSPVRILRLMGLDASAGTQLLAEEDVAGSEHERARLVEAYGGNPLALRIVAQSIVELFGGDLASFLEQGNIIFGGVRELLREQFERLSSLERRMFFWLAILREPVRLEELLAVADQPQAGVKVLEALNGLHRRSLVERGQRAGSFTLQSVVLEYATARLVEETSSEIEQGQMERFIHLALCQAHAKEYVREVQQRLLVVPLLTWLQTVYSGRDVIEARFLELLDELRGWDHQSQGYGPANLVTLLRALRGNLRGIDLSRLSLCGVSLHDVEMQDTQLSGAIIRDCIFTEPFDVIRMVAVSSNGQRWAIGSRSGEVRLRGEGGKTLSRVWQAHLADMTSLAFSPDGSTLVSVSFDNTIKLWEVETGTLLWTGWHTGGISTAAFAPDGHLLASGGNDGHIRMWDVQAGIEIQALPNQNSVIGSLAWSPDGKLLASGCTDGNIWIWDILEAAPVTQARKLTGHTHWVPGLAFSPDSAQLASASFDGTVKLWDPVRGDCRRTISEHSAEMLRVVWSSDGQMLATCSFDHTIWLWNPTQWQPQAMLHGHSGVIYGLAFAPDSQILLSGSDDGTIRVWDVARAQVTRVIRGYVATLFDVDWSPDSTWLAAAGADTSVIVRNRVGSTPPKILRGHRWIVQGVAWSPDGQLLASGGYDNSIGLWDPATGVRKHELCDPDVANTIFLGLAWSPDGQTLACGSYQRGVQVWDRASRTQRWVGRTTPTLLRRVAWSPDGTQLAGAGGDGFVYVWDATHGTLLQKLAGHDRPLLGITWSPDGHHIVAGGGGRVGGEIFVWDAYTGERVQIVEAHPGLVTAVAWGTRGNVLISGGSDGTMRWWDIQSGECVRAHQGHQGTVQALKVSPDGSMLASCGDDGAIVLWDLHTGEQLQMLRQDRPYERMDISGMTGVSPAQRASLIALGAVDRTAHG